MHRQRENEFFGWKIGASCGVVEKGLLVCFVAAMEKFVSASKTPSQHQPPPPMMPPRPPLLKISTKTPRKPLLKSFNVAAQLPSDDDKVMEVTSTSAVPDMPQFKLKKGRCFVDEEVRFLF